MALPVLFISHGAPTMLVDNSPTRKFLQGFGDELRTKHQALKAIVCISAHWETNLPAIVAHQDPPLVYDFYGFPQELYDFQYSPLGHPPLATQIQRLLQGAGLNAELDSARGLDHGAWVPLSLLFPKANIPIIQVSIQPGQSLAHHLQLGEALRPLREEGVLIVGSGGATHNLRAFRGQPYDAPVCREAQEFSTWLQLQATSGNRANLESFEELAPFSKWNHPTLDHILPFFVALGAASKPKATLLQSAFAFGFLSLDAFSWN
jgi:4,5-DOPA dioxygenase extradiol